MSVIPRVSCKRCGREFSALRSRCPYCGTRRVKNGDRVPMGTASENPGTAAAERAAVNTRWQMIFGMILLAAVVIAVIVLITVGLNDARTNASSAAQNTPTQNTSVVPSDELDADNSDEPATPSDDPDADSSAEPSTEPADSPSPSVAPGSITLTFLGSPRTEFAAAVGDEVQLKAEIYPQGAEGTVTWKSDNETVAKVVDGKVTGVGAGTTTITATCGDLTATCKVYITG